MAFIGCERPDFVDFPKVVPVPEGHIRNVLLKCKVIQLFARLGIAFIGQLAVTVDDVVTAPLQFGGDRSLASPGNAFDQIIPDTHFALVR